MPGPYDLRNQWSEIYCPSPLDEEGDNTDGEVFIYRYLESEDGEPELDNILDDEEYEIAADAFDEWLDTQEFDEMSE